MQGKWTVLIIFSFRATNLTKFIKHTCNIKRRPVPEHQAYPREHRHGVEPVQRPAAAPELLRGEHPLHLSLSLTQTVGLDGSSY